MKVSPLLQLARRLHTATDLPAAMEAARDAIVEATRYESVYTMVISPDGKSFEVVGYVLPDAEMVRQQAATVALDRDPFLKRVFASDEPLVFEDLRLVDDADQAQVEAFGLRTAIAVPMMNGEMRLGPLQIATFADSGVMLPTEAELDFFVQVASLMAVVITRMRSEDQKAKLELQIRSSQRLESLGRLAGEVAHDFNNLFLTILANAEIAIEELRAHSALTYIEDIQEATQRAARLSRQLLAFSKGQLLDTRILDVADLVTRTSRVLSPLLPQGVEVKLQLSPDTGCVDADQGQIEQVLMNLLINAKDAVGTTGRITIETESLLLSEEFIDDKAKVPPGSYAVISVSDDGEGISRELQDKIFEPYFTTKSQSNGTGLGLAVVQGVIAQHGGYLVLYSEQGVGTTFKVYLPLSDQKNAPLPEPTPTTANQGQGEVILVVDDQPQIRRSVARALERAGYRVALAGSREEAISLIDASPPDLLLTDIIMGSDSGLTLAEQVRSQYPKLAILLMTGYAPSQIGRVSFPHINKPFSAAMLTTQIRTLLDRPA